MDEWKKDKPYYDYSVEELEKFPIVKFEIAKDAFDGPFSCCHTKTQKVRKKKILNHITFEYEVWRCPKCKTDYLDSKQARIYEKFYFINKAIEEEIKFKRNLNYDGHNYFVRFPNEVTHNWHKKMTVSIIPVASNEFFVKIE